MSKAMDDLKSTTRYVTWSLHNKNKAGLKSVFKESEGSESDGGKSEQEVSCFAFPSSFLPLHVLTLVFFFRL